MITHEVSNGCRCAEPRRSQSYHNGAPSKSCNRCSMTVTSQPWHLTPEGMRGFLAAASEGAPDIGHEQMTAFASYAIGRAFDKEAIRKYELHGFLKRQLEGEAEAELLDAANYAYFRVLKDRWLVEQGEMDSEHASERERHLMNLAAETIRLHEAFRFFWQNL